MSKKCLFEHVITAFLIPSEKFIRLLIHFLMNIFVLYFYESKVLTRAFDHCISHSLETTCSRSLKNGPAKRAPLLK